MNESIGSAPFYAMFTLFVFLMLGLDLVVFHRRAHSPSIREAIAWSVVWIGLAMAFNAYIVWDFGMERGAEFFAGYVLEKSLSVDNLFVFLLIFNYFKVPAEFQHEVLFFGILGALVMRALFIGLGAVLLAKFHFVLYVFGFFLIWTGLKMLFADEDDMDPANHPIVAFVRRRMRYVDEFHGDRFFIRTEKGLTATRLFMVLVVIEISDLVFAVDSVPAIFGITKDPFLVYTSNIFAILGLRSLYFLLEKMMARFHYLKVGLGVILTFVGVKMAIAEAYHVRIDMALLFILFVLVLSVSLSLRKERLDRLTEPAEAED